ncbi:MAG: nicotinate phosphoribosyltransferase [Cyclobacteriaceae bacterium]|nr:nicotinate phosphoribosyltransferase [Cyclobacteriaceae bacterium]MCH8516634.1 nicotinate phosphoribosyltransferase [Cyclobacteriaceae bacterium]
MTQVNNLYKPSLALLTDLYQVTMAYGYWKAGKAEDRSVFHLYFRENPFNSGYTVNCGLSQAIAFLKDFRFQDSDLSYLSTLKGNDGKPLFDASFFEYLKNLRFECDVYAIAEGRIVFPNEPLIRVEGPILQAQLIESALLNIINFQSLIATKAARLRFAAGDDKLLEFGLRRAQGIDGALSGSRAAYIGGCDATSNVLAGKLYNIPVSGTQAHSWVMSFEEEDEAFEQFAAAQPNNTVLLVDTFNILDGVKKAIAVGLKMKQAGKHLMGIRIDSGDLAWYAQKAKIMLDEAGLEDVAIVASNDLDEELIVNLKLQQKAISVWGVGTKLITADAQPALGGVYKLSAIKEVGKSKYRDTIKLSAQSAKINTPGILQVKRYYLNNQLLFADMIHDEREKLSDAPLMIDPNDPTKQMRIDRNKIEEVDLLQPIFDKGVFCGLDEDIDTIKNRVKYELASLADGIKRFKNPHVYPVGMSESLYNRKKDLILGLRSKVNNA